MSEQSKQGPAITAAELDGIDAKLKLCTDPPFEVVGARRHCGISRRGRVVVVRADEHDIDDLEAMSDLRNHAEALLALARKGLEAEASPKCEGCKRPATRQDDEGVPLCDACWGELIVEEYRDLAKKHEESGIHIVLARAACESAESKLAAALAELATLKAERDASEPSKADRCVNCAFGSRACRQCRDRVALAAALAEVERLRGRLEKATYFEWEDAAGADWTIWRRPTTAAMDACSVTRGNKQIARGLTLDAAWAAAEQAAQAQGGEGRA